MSSSEKDAAPGSRQHPTMTVAEVAAHLRVNAATVYRHAKKLGGIKIGGALRFNRSFIEGGIWEQGRAEGPLDFAKWQHPRQAQCAAKRSASMRRVGAAKPVSHGVDDDPYGLLSGRAGSAKPQEKL